MSEELTEADLVLMEGRGTHRVEPWRPEHKDLLELRDDNRKLIAEVRRLQEVEQNGAKSRTR